MAGSSVSPKIARFQGPVFRWLALIGALTAGFGVADGAVHGASATAVVWVVAGVAIGVLAVLVRVGPAQAMLAGVVLTAGILAAAVASTVNGAAEVVGIRVMNRVWPPNPQFDLSALPPAEQGHAWPAGSEVRHETPEFDVTYTLDERGCRVTPEPTERLGRVAVFGGSFTFGHGVEDDEHYPAILGRRLLRRYKVRNYAVNGWGTWQSMTRLDRELGSGEAPALILYGWISDHARRNGGVEQTVEILREMHGRCEAAGVAFFVLLLPEPDADAAVDRAVFGPLEGEGLRVVDLRGACDDFYAFDRHPTPRCHRAIAAAVAAEARIRAALAGAGG